MWFCVGFVVLSGKATRAKNLFDFFKFQSKSMGSSASPLVAATTRMSPLPAPNTPSSPLATPLPQGHGTSPVPTATSHTRNRTSRTSSMASDSGPSHRTASPYSFPSSPASDASSELSQDGFMDTDDTNTHH